MITQAIDMTADDEAAIRALYQQMMDGWNQGNGEAFAENGDLVAFDGLHFEGCQANISFQQPLFDKWLKGTRLVGRVKSMRFLTPDVALMHVIGGTIMRGESRPSPVRDSIQALVAVRRDGEWKLAAFQIRGFDLWAAVSHQRYYGCLPIGYGSSYFAIAKKQIHPVPILFDERL